MGLSLWWRGHGPFPLVNQLWFNAFAPRLPVPEEPSPHGKPRPEERMESACTTFFYDLRGGSALGQRQRRWPRPSGPIYLQSTKTGQFPTIGQNEWWGIEWWPITTIRFLPSSSSFFRRSAINNKVPGPVPDLCDQVRPRPRARPHPPNPRLEVSAQDRPF